VEYYRSTATDQKRRDTSSQI